MELQFSMNSVSWPRVNPLLSFTVLLVGWTKQQLTNLNHHSFDPSGAAHGTNSLKYRVVNLVFSVKMVFRIPLIVVNALVIVFELIFG